MHELLLFSQISNFDKFLSGSRFDDDLRIDFECFIPSTLSWLSNPYISFITPGAESMPYGGAHFRIQETIKKRYEKPLHKKNRKKIESKKYIKI